MTVEELRATLIDIAREHDLSKAMLAHETPKVLDGHSDGKRVRYVRHAVAADTIVAVLAMLESVKA